MTNNKWNTTSSIYNSLSDFCITPAQSSLVSFPDQKGQYDFLLKIMDNRPLIVFFNAAFTGAQKQNGTNQNPTADSSASNSIRKGLRLPSFSGYNLLEQVDASYVCINDPSLYLSDKLNLAWYLGANDIHAQTVIVQVLKKIIDQLKPSRLIFVGGSGGGYAAMYYSSFFSESLALPWNPQTDIFKFIPDSVTTYLRHAWNFDGSIEEGKDYLQGIIETDLFSRYTKENPSSSNYLIYLQNASDHHHIDAHLKPFLSNLGISQPTELTRVGGDFSPRRHLKIMNTGSGHAAPSFASLVETLNNLATTDLTWHEMFASNKINEIISIRGR
ncbi:hypothetical protein EV681_2669 [Advenella incenata]|uniref:Esterase n=1 Tax=Advenella incenata TaxID=267800 RepID=A0A4Q7VBN3_9BURK|nr:hypothetical protein [Advenella incenata]RZT94251.1 hypothetical protein EV681_2669 [Advenella incenata]